MKAQWNADVCDISNNSKTFTISIDLIDGKISLNEEHKNSLGTLSTVISSKKFCELYN